MRVPETYADADHSILRELQKREHLVAAASSKYTEWRIKAEFDNGKEYYAMHGTKLGLPERGSFQPDPELLRWHNEAVFFS